MSSRKRRRRPRASIQARAMARPPRLIVIDPGQDRQPQPISLSAQDEDLQAMAIGPHLFPEVWSPLDWIAPVKEGRHCVQHHPDCTPAYHPMCGPILFCCLKAFDLYKRYYPDSGVAQATWGLAAAAEMKVWFEADTTVIYFVFCDPHRADGLYSMGLEGPMLQDVFHKRVPIEAYIRYADRVG